jgi:hypothetical protein
MSILVCVAVLEDKVEKVLEKIVVALPKIDAKSCRIPRTNSRVTAGYESAS